MGGLDKVNLENFSEFKLLNTEVNSPIFHQTDKKLVHLELLNTLEGARYRIDFLEIVKERKKIAEEYAFNVFMTLVSGGTSSWAAAMTRALNDLNNASKAVTTAVMIANASRKAQKANMLALSVDISWTSLDLLNTAQTCEDKLARELDLESTFKKQVNTMCSNDIHSIFANSNKEKQFFGCVAEFMFILGLEAFLDVWQIKEIMEYRKIWKQNNQVIGK